MNEKQEQLPSAALTLKCAIGYGGSRESTLGWALSVPPVRIDGHNEGFCHQEEGRVTGWSERGERNDDGDALRLHVRVPSELGRARSLMRPNSDNDPRVHKNGVISPRGKIAL